MLQAPLQAAEFTIKNPAFSGRASETASGSAFIEEQFQSDF